MSAKEVLMAAAGAALPLPEFVSSSRNTTGNTGFITLAAPSGIQDGDLLVALIYADDSGASCRVDGPPSGFVTIFQDTSANPAFSVHTKTAASESGTYTFDFSSSVNASMGAMLVYRNANRVNTLSGINRDAGGTATALSITPSLMGILLASFTNGSTATISTPPSGMTQRVAAGSPYGKGHTVYELSPQASVATGNKTLVWNASGNVSGSQLQITNEPSIAPEFVGSDKTQTTSGTTSLTINKPSGTIQGDLMVAVMASTSITNVLWSGATGWTEVADQGAPPSLRIAYKVAGASEGSSYTFTHAASALLSGCILTYRYAAYDAAGTYWTGSSLLQMPSVTTSASQSILIAAAARGAASITITTPIGMTLRVLDNDVDSPSYNACSQSVAKGPTGVRFATTGSSTNSAGIMLSIKPTRSL